MRYLLIAALMCSACNEGKLAAQKTEIEQLKAQVAEGVAAVQKLQAQNNIQALLVEDAQKEAAPCSESEMARQIRTVVASSIWSFSQNMGMRPEEILNDHGRLKDPAGLAVRLRAWYMRRSKRTALTGLIADFGTDAGTAIYYGRVGKTDDE